MADVKQEAARRAEFAALLKNSTGCQSSSMSITISATTMADTIG